MSDPSSFMLWVEHFGGRIEREFIQDNYICQFREEFHGGCCMALCCCWAYCKCDMDAFISYIDSPIGKSRVRGVQGMAIHCSQAAYDLGGNHYSGFVECVWNAFGLQVDGRRQCGPTMTPNLIADFCCSLPCFTQIHIQSPDNTKSHAMACCRVNGGIKFFDPNYGGCFFDKKSKFNSFFGQFFDLFYPEYTGEWECFSGRIPGIHI